MGWGPFAIRKGLIQPVKLVLFFIQILERRIALYISFIYVASCKTPRFKLVSLQAGLSFSRLQIPEPDFHVMTNVPVA